VGQERNPVLAAGSAAMNFGTGGGLFNNPLLRKSGGKGEKTVSRNGNERESHVLRSPFLG